MSRLGSATWAGRDTGTPARAPDAERARRARRRARLLGGRTAAASRPSCCLPDWSIVALAPVEGARSPTWRATAAWSPSTPRGNGLSDRPTDPAAYADAEFVGRRPRGARRGSASTRAALVGLSRGARCALDARRARTPSASAASSASRPCPMPSPPPERCTRRAGDGRRTRAGRRTTATTGTRDYRGFLEFFFGEIVPRAALDEGRSRTASAWGLDTTPETLIARRPAATAASRPRGGSRRCAARSRCPVAGRPRRRRPDACRPSAAQRAGRARPAAELVLLEGAGHLPIARDPVAVNLLAARRSPCGPRAAGARLDARRARGRARALVRVLADRARARLARPRDRRRAAPPRARLEIDWLAQEPVTDACCEARGETIHPASAELRQRGGAHRRARPASTTCTRSRRSAGWTRSSCANFMLFHDVVREQRYDLWVGDEAWELDHFLHENPELKTAPFAWLTDFVGWLPMPDGRRARGRATADYNAEMIEHVARLPRVRDRAIFVGDPEDVVAGAVRARPARRSATGPSAHYDFAGLRHRLRPGGVADRDGAARRARLGPATSRCAWSPSAAAGVGRRTCCAGPWRRCPLLRERVPGLRMVVVAGPAASTRPRSPRRRRARGPRLRATSLHRLLAACDVALVQGGLTTTMELVAAGRPFVCVPLERPLRAERPRAPPPRPLRRAGVAAVGGGDARTRSPTRSPRRGRPAPRYRPVPDDGAARAADALAGLLVATVRG